MTELSPLQFTQPEFFDLFSTAYAAACARGRVPAANLGPGSALGPVGQAASQVCTQIQAQIDLAEAYGRLLTIPENADGTPNPAVDSFIKPFGFTRLPGTFATTVLNLGPPSPSPVPQVYPVGMILTRDTDGAQFILIQDASQNAFSLGAGVNGGYTMAANQAVGATIPVSAQCLQEGTFGNCKAGAINELYTGPGAVVPATTPGIITNPVDVTNGVDVESDPAVKARFQLQGGLPHYGVRAAILSAVAATQAGLVYQYGDYKNPDGSYHGAYFCVIVNNANSSTAPSPGLIAAVKANVERVRAGGIEFGVFPPTLLPVTVTGQLTLLTGQDPNTVKAAAVAAIQAYVNGLGLNSDGTPIVLSWGKIVSILDTEVPGVSGVQSVLVNGGTVDLTATFAHEFTFNTATAFTA
jgi:hypothetical protein